MSILGRFSSNTVARIPLFARAGGNFIANLRDELSGVKLSKGLQAQAHGHSGLKETAAKRNGGQYLSVSWAGSGASVGADRQSESNATLTCPSEQLSLESSSFVPPPPVPASGGVQAQIDV